MDANKRAIKGGIIFAILFIAITIIIGKNIHLKKELKSLHSPVYVWKAEELARISRKAYKDAVVILNEEQGLWERHGGATIKVVRDLIIEENENDEHYLFYDVIDVIADDDGNIYVLLRKQGLIRKFDSNGRYLLTIGKEGQGPGELLQPARLFIDSKNILHVIEYGNRRVSRFSLDGGYVGSTPVQFQRIPRQFGVDENGNYYISFLNETNQTTIHQFNFQGRLVKSFGEPLFLTRPIHFAERGPVVADCSQGHIFADKDFLYFCRRNPYEIRKYTYDGKLKMLIFRKNNFMPPQQMIIAGKQRYQFYSMVSLDVIYLRNNYIYCFVSIPENILKNKIKWIIDGFDINGNLLFSHKNYDEFLPTYLDKNYNIYGFSFGDIPKIYRYSMKILTPKKLMEGGEIRNE